MDKIIVREAIPADLGALLACEEAIVASERPFDSTLKEGEIHYYDLAGMIAADHTGVFVAELNGEIVGSGYAWAENSKPYQKHSVFAYLGCMYVKQEYRGKGVNSMVIAALKDWCRGKGISELRLEVYTNNLPAIKAYEKAGFGQLLTWMRMNLDEA